MKSAFLGAASLAAALAACSAASVPQADIKSANWIAPGIDLVEALTTQPATCRGEKLKTIEADRGEVLFNSPLLLGGQAAKASLSCASCHQNGRGNPYFVFAGLNDDPGVVDVTHGLFSKVRADGTDNPVPIPDLAGRSARKVDHAKAGVLESFLYLQITEEFQGIAPTEDVISALAAYLRSLDDTACGAQSREPLVWEAEMNRTEVALAAVINSDDLSTRQMYKNAARAALGRLHERFPQEAVRVKLIQLSKDIQNEVSADLLAGKVRILRDDLSRYEQQSFYNPDYLRRGL